MSRLDSLRAGGRLDSKGAFDLDPIEARDKLKKYQLAEPEKYILRFVEAAVVLGTEFVEFTIDSDEVEMSFGGDSLDQGHLEDFYLYAFGRTTDHRLEAVRLLALGVMSAQGINPSRILIETGSDPRIRLTVSNDEESVEPVARLSNRSGNRIYLRERPRVGHLKEFLSRIPGVTTRFHELTVLRACRYASIPVTVNGEDYAIGLAESRSLRVEVIDVPHTRGWVRFHRSTRDPGRLTLIQNGVIIEETHLDVGDTTIEAVIESSALSTNLSFSGFVRNDAWHELIDEILMPAVCRLYMRNSSRQMQAARRIAIADIANAALRTRARLLERYREPDPVFDELLVYIADAAIWRAMSVEETDQINLTTLLSVFGEGPIYITRNEYPGIPATGEDGRILDFVLSIESGVRFGEGDPRALASATGRRLVDLTEQLQERHRERIISSGQAGSRFDGWSPRWPHRFHEPYGPAETVEYDGLSGGVGFDPNSPLDVARMLVKRGPRDVEEHIRDAGILNRLTISVASQNEMPMETLMRDCAALVAEALARVVLTRRTIHPREHPWFVGAMASLVSGCLAEDVGRVFGHDSFKLSWPEVNDPNSVLRDHQIIEQVAGGRVAINELTTPVEFVPETNRFRALQVAYEVELTERRSVVWLDEDRQSILKNLLGDDAIIDVTDELAAHARRIQRSNQGFEEDVELHGSFELTRLLTGGGFHAEIGLSSDWHAHPGSIHVLFLHERKHLTTRRISTDYGRFRAVVAGPLQPTPNLDDVIEDEAYAALVERLRSVSLALFETHATKLVEDNQLTEPQQLTLWRAVADAMDGPARYRLNWPVFSTSEGMLSFHELAARRRTYKPGEDPDACFVFLPTVPGDRIQLLERLFGDIIDLGPGTRTRQVADGAGPLHELRAELNRLVPDASIEFRSRDQELRRVGRSISIGNENPLVSRFIEQPQLAALILAVWLDPTRAASHLDRSSLE